MAIVVDGTSVVPLTGGKPLGEDEKQLLDALHGRGELGTRLKADLEKQRARAKYKIELQFHKDRGGAVHSVNLGSIMVWESGRRFHGGGDQRMVFCGYTGTQGFSPDEVCGKPIRDEHFGVSHLVCPHCSRECFLDEATKRQHLKVAKREGFDLSGLLRMPIANPSMIAKMSAKPLSVLVAKTFRDLESNADIYVKYHPEDIRSHDVPEAKIPGVYERARAARVEKKENRGLVIYPIEHIIRDTVGGAALESRIQALLMA